MFGFLAQLLSWCYQVWPNYAGMVLLFTLIVMLVVTPFTIKGMRSAAEMSRLQPEMKKLQDQYKNDRVKQNEEMQALFKEHGVNPLGGCLPTLLPLPIFFIIFRLLERMNARRSGAFSPLVRLVRHNVGGAVGYVAPHYLSYKAPLTQAIIHSNGQLKAFGVDLAVTAGQHHPSVGKAIPYYLLIVVMTASQYWQQRQINQRNPAAANANPQMKLTMQMFPAIYALISFRIPAAVVLYLLLSGLFRMAQNSISYRFDPVLARAATPPDKTIEASSRPKVGAGAKGAAGARSVGSGGASKAALTSGKPVSGRVTPPTGRSSAGTASGKGVAPAGKGAKSGGKGTAPAAAASGGGFMERLRAQAAEAKAQGDRARQEKSGRDAGANGNSGGRSATSGGRSGNDKSAGRPQNASSGTAGDLHLPVDNPVDEAVDEQIAEAGQGGELLGADDDIRAVDGVDGVDRVDRVDRAGRAEDGDEAIGDDDLPSPAARPSASPLSIRPSGRRPKNGR